MTAYDIYDEANPKAKLATVDAPHPIDALAEYSIAQGYADPRLLEDGPQWFTQAYDGRTRMVFEATELVAVAADEE
jgi:hypothetical protein